MTLLLLVLIVIAITGGGLGYSRYGAIGGLSPLGVVLLIVTLMYLTGNL
jgi:hypothetical protein